MMPQVAVQLRREPDLGAATAPERAADAAFAVLSAVASLAAHVSPYRHAIQAQMALIQEDLVGLALRLELQAAVSCGVRAGLGKDIELRHQRNPDVIFDMMRKRQCGYGASCNL